MCGSRPTPGLTVRLAYYPPYQSKYNPIARCWGILEQHGNGTLLDPLDTVLQFAATMTWKGVRPTVTPVTTTYERGVTLTREAMADVEAHLTRHPTLGKWFVAIHPPPAGRERYSLGGPERSGQVSPARGRVGRSA